VKEVIAKGTGKGIEAGDILAGEYVAYVRGAEKPFAKGDREKFIVKDGSLIKGWDIAVSSMKIGEKARFRCTPEYAWGKDGVAPVIPPNAEIEVELKVLAWLGNQLQPESLFQKDLDIDPFIASTPESIQAEYDDMQVSIFTN
jgi:FKBP-type peptidyl-prolyl cis-trans isomerase